jgi:hypothetical protein
MNRRSVIYNLSNFFLIEDHFKSKPVDGSSIYPAPDTDELFGCFYILKYGVVKYETTIHLNKHEIETYSKLECLEYIFKNKPAVRKLNRLLSAAYYAERLEVGTKIDLHTFFILCHLYNLNITYICNKVYYTTLSNEALSLDPDDTLRYILCKKSTHSYHIQEVTQSDMNIGNTMFRIHSLASPLPDISKMSKDQLVHILETYCNNGDIASIFTSRKLLYDYVKSLLKLI